MQNQPETHHELSLVLRRQAWWPHLGALAGSEARQIPMQRGNAGLPVLRDVLLDLGFCSEDITRSPYLTKWDRYMFFPSEQQISISLRGVMHYIEGNIRLHLLP